MSYYNMILLYVNNLPLGKPFSIDDTEKYIFRFCKKEDKKKLHNNVKVVLSQINKAGLIKTAYRGIYYVPKKNVFGEMLLGNGEIVKYKYLIDEDNNIKGYITSAKLFNDVHLTTQVPNVIDIATNECKNSNKIFNRKLNVILRKPKITVNNENYQYLQLFDLIENKDNIQIEADNPDDKIYNFIKINNLDFEKIIKYAVRVQNRKIINKILTLAR